MILCIEEPHDLADLVRVLIPQPAPDPVAQRPQPQEAGSNAETALAVGSVLSSTNPRAGSGRLCQAGE